MHTLIRLRGFGYGIVPYAPYELARIGDGADDQVLFDCDGRRAHVDPRKLEVAETLEGVADVHAADSDDEWRIDFGRWTVSWPNQYRVRSPDADDDTPFLLHGGPGLVWIRGPFAPLPRESRLVAPGQRLADRGDEEGVRWIEVHYEEQGEGWLQRHIVLATGLLVTAQAPRSTGCGGAAQVAMGLAQELLEQG